MVDLPTLRAFEEEVRKTVPPFKLGFKDESFFQRLIGFLFPVNPDFMRRFATTFYPTVFFPSKAYYEGQPQNSFSILAHEMVHLVDTTRQPIWFRLSYALPQLAAVLPLIVYAALAREHAWVLGVALGSYLLGCLCAKKSLGLFYVFSIGGVVGTSVLAILLTHWYSAALFAGFALIAPWPSAGRTKWELRGYSMNLAVMQWTYGQVPDFYRQSVLKNFTGSAYYFMSWGAVYTRAKIDEIVTRAQSGDLQKELPYSVVYSFMRNHGLLKK